MIKDIIETIEGSCKEKQERRLRMDRNEMAYRALTKDERTKKISILEDSRKSRIIYIHLY
jgi:hypothetical protein